MSDCGSCGKPPKKPPVTLPPVTAPPVELPPIKPPVTLQPLKPPITLQPVTGPPVVKPPAKPCPTPAPPATCPIDTLKLGACMDLIGGLEHVGLGDPFVNKCCPILAGLVEVEAAVCLCTTLKVKLLNLKVFVPLALELLVTCGKTPGYTCTIRNKQPNKVAKAAKKWKSESGGCQKKHPT